MYQSSASVYLMVIIYCLKEVVQVSSFPSESTRGGSSSASGSGQHTPKKGSDLLNRNGDDQQQLNHNQQQEDYTSFRNNPYPPGYMMQMESSPSLTSSSQDYNQQQVDADPSQAASHERLPIFREPMGPPSDISDHSPDHLQGSGSSGSRDMETAPSHHHGHHGGHDHHGWLDMGAYSGKKGAFGWYADFPVGGHGK